MKVGRMIGILAIITAIFLWRLFATTETEPGATTVDQFSGLVVTLGALGGFSALAGYICKRYFKWDPVLAAGIAYIVLLYLAASVRY